MPSIGNKYITPPKHLKDISALGKDYTIGRIIGTGKYAVVCDGSMKKESQKVTIAVKVIDLKSASELYRLKFLPKELWALEELKHSNIVKVYDIKVSVNTFYIFMEMAFGGDILNMFDECKNGIPEDRTKKLYKMIANATHYIHSLGAAHRDIKCDNILLMNKERTVAKLTDFGFATTCYLPQTKQKILKDTYCGTPQYSAPELDRHQPYDAMKCDVWSMGVVLFIMLQNEMPFTQKNIYDMANDRKPVPIEFSNKKLSKECKDLIVKQLEIDPKKRLTMAQVLEHQWLCK